MDLQVYFILKCYDICNDQMSKWDRASGSCSVDSGFDSESRQTDDLKICICSFPAGQCGARWLVRLFSCWERHITGFHYLGVIDIWPATTKQACFAVGKSTCIHGWQLQSKLVQRSVAFS